MPIRGPLPGAFDDRRAPPVAADREPQEIFANCPTRTPLLTEQARNEERGQ